MKLCRQFKADIKERDGKQVLQISRFSGASERIHRRPRHFLAEVLAISGHGALRALARHEETCRRKKGEHDESFSLYIQATIVSAPVRWQLGSLAQTRVPGLGDPRVGWCIKRGRHAACVSAEAYASAPRGLAIDTLPQFPQSPNGGTETHTEKLKYFFFFFQQRNEGEQSPLGKEGFEMGGI